MATKKGKSRKKPSVKPEPLRRRFFGERERLFCIEYLQDFNGPRAARAAGFADSSSAAKARELLDRPEIQEVIEEMLDNAAKTAGVSKVWALRRFKDVSDRCFQAEPVRDREGKETGEYKFDSAGALRGAELVGKALGMFTEKVEHSGSVNVELTDAQNALAAIVSSLARRNQPAEGDRQPE